MDHAARHRSSSALARIGGLALLLLGASLAAYRFGWLDYHDTIRHMDRIQRSHGVIEFTLSFVAIYGLVTSIGFPGLPFTVAAGALFGGPVGTMVSWSGALVGATVGYWVARTVGHDIVLRWLTRSSRAKGAVDQARDFDGLLRLRLIPVLPLGTVNFVGGLARAPFARYLAATALGVIPSTVVYTYFADSLLDSIGTGSRNALATLIVASALIILVSLVPKRMARRQARGSAAAATSDQSAPGD